MMLEHKVTVIYGAGGAIGSAVARAFAREGARLFLTGRRRALVDYVTSYFLTARLAGRRMLAKRSGVIMTVTALPSRTGNPLLGGYGPAMAAKEALTRSLSGELAAHGIRVVGLRPNGIPETRALREAFELRAKPAGTTWEAFQELLAARTHPRRLMTLGETAEMAVFMASDRASGMTGTTVNLSMGTLDD